MEPDEVFFPNLEALTTLYASEQPVKKKAKLLRKVPMLLSEESEPLNTILICRHPEERILIAKEFAELDRKKLKKIPE